MNKKSILATLVILTGSLAYADKDTAVPPEVQKLAEKLVAALKSSDDAALLACWHTPETLAKVKQAKEAAEAAAKGKTLSPEDLADEGKDEIKSRTKENKDTTERAARLRAFLTKHFGQLSALTLQSVDLDEDKDAPAERPAYDDVDLLLRTADGTMLTIDVDDLVKIDGAWKFTGRLDDDISIQLAEKN
jgi:hypothetical protein